MTDTATHQSTTFQRDIVFAVPLVAAGLGCLVLLTLSDARGKFSFPPDDSLFSGPNWVEVVAITIGGLLIAIPRVPRPAKLAAGAVAAISAALVFGTAVWAVKHWVPFGGMTGLARKRAEDMADLSLILAFVALVAGLSAAGWLARSGAITTGAAPNVRSASIAAGIGTIIALPLMIGFGTGDEELTDVTSLGTFALLYSLPYGLAFIVAAFLRRPAALGALATAAASIAYLTVVLLLESVYPIVTVGFGLLLLTNVWLIAMTWRDGARPASDASSAPI